MSGAYPSVSAFAMSIVAARWSAVCSPDKACPPYPAPFGRADGRPGSDRPTGDRSRYRAQALSSDAMKVFTGRQGDYVWVAAHDGLSCLPKVLAGCPDTVVGRTVVITSFDSGPLIPNARESEAGWRTRGGLMVNAMVADPSSIPYEQYDEWLIFPKPGQALEDVEVFVNYGGFTLAGPRVDRADWDPTWDRTVDPDPDRPVRERFWTQLKRLRPETYIAEGDNFVFVTNRLELAHRVAKLLQARRE